MSEQYPPITIEHRRLAGRSLTGGVENPQGMTGSEFAQRMREAEDAQERRLAQQIGQPGVYPNSRFHRGPGDSLTGGSPHQGWEVEESRE